MVDWYPTLIGFAKKRGKLTWDKNGLTPELDGFNFWRLIKRVRLGCIVTSAKDRCPECQSCFPAVSEHSSSSSSTSSSSSSTSSSSTSSSSSSFSSCLSQKTACGICMIKPLRS